jgi:hypothetical protein
LKVNTLTISFRPLQTSDLDDKRRLEQYVRGLEELVQSTSRALESLQKEVVRRDQLTSTDLVTIKRALESGGIAELDLTNLSGINAETIDARIPRLTSAPDPYQTPYDTYVLTGSPDTLWQIDRSTNPPTAVQIAFVSNHALLSSTHTDTVASAVSRGSLIKGNATPAYEEFVLGTALQLLRVNAGATDLEYGGVDDGQLSSNVAKKNVNNNFTASQTITGDLTASGALNADNGLIANGFAVGSLRVGTSGSVFVQFKAFTATLSPAAVGAGTTSAQNLTFTGVTTSDLIVHVKKPTEQTGLGIVGHRASAADTITVVFMNDTAASITPTAGETYTAVALRI